MKELKRAKSIHELLNTNFDVMNFEGEWKELMGQPERTGSWFIWGDSSNGKTSFALKLCGYLTNFGRVAYNPLEEGASESFKKALIRANLQSVGTKMIILDKEPIKELRQRLQKRRSPDFVVIDSIQYAGMNYRDYVQLISEFRNKVFIIISHADGKEPRGSTAKSIRYDAFIKIRIEGYKAFAVSRFGGGEPMTIWKTGAEEYWNKID